MIERLWRGLFWVMTRRARTPRRLRAGVAIACAAGALVLLARPAPSPAAGGGATPGASTPVVTTPGPLKSLGGPPTTSPNAPRKSSEPPGPGNLVHTFPSSPQLVSQGMTIYENGCSSCHGTLLQGQAGVAPSLVGVGAGPVNFYVSSGRMPLPAPKEEPMRSEPLYTRPQINALIAFITHYGGGPPSADANPSAGDLQLGFHLFTLHCAGCHQIVARGGIVTGALVPNLLAASPLQIAEAVRMGPYLMPHFDATEIDQHQLDSLARYILWTRHPSDLGGWGIYNIGPIPEGIIAWFLALAAMLIVARLIGERVA